MDQNPPTSSAVLLPQQIHPNPSINGGLNNIESGYPMSGSTHQQVVPYFAGNPSQVLRQAPTKAGCNGPTCCIPLQTACFLIGVLGIVSVIFDVIVVLNGSRSKPKVLIMDYLPPVYFIVGGLPWEKNNSISIFPGLFLFFSLVILIVNVILIVGSKKKNSMCVIIYMIATGVYVHTLFIVILLRLTPSSGMALFYYFYMLPLIYVSVVAGFYYKELKAGQTPRQGQVYMPQAQGQVLVTPGPSQISWSPSQANMQSGQVIGSPEQGQYGQSY